MKSILIWLVAYYKHCYNPLFSNHCKFIPSCSAHMVQAIKKRGAFLGFMIGVWRLLRCNPFTKGGFNPVKENFRGRAKWLL